jgi:hypothetical protein
MALARVLILGFVGLAVLLFPLAGMATPDSSSHPALILQDDDHHDGHTHRDGASDHQGSMHHGHHHIDHSHQTLAMTAANPFVTDSPASIWNTWIAVMEIPVRIFGPDRPPRT